jgi:hypothetical protein
MFQSDAKQDLFVANIFKYKQDGVYVDIGSAHSVYSNNTIYFDQILNWKGLCVEYNSVYNSSYGNRKNCIYLNEDALKVQYEKVFQDNNFPNIIDYLSLDVDTISLSVLKILPFNLYKFKVITIEHDAYLYGDEYRNPQRKILLDQGYHLIVENVFARVENRLHEECPFEDWYVHPDFFDMNSLKKIESKNIKPEVVISKFE